MSVVDKHGRDIEVGSYVIYTRVGTVGEVMDTKTDKDGSWVLVQYDDLTKLWYNTRNIEITDKKYYKDTTNEPKEITMEDIKKQVNKKVSSEMSGHAVGGG
ncbi:MAG: hypothetical protein BZ133_04780 [Methanosphaera sp. SHI613]|jgi:hypothetical protein|nr:MAG: hypothetical protein BZ133_04780 [Methanosphaera sp. SHI613]